MSTLQDTKELAAIIFKRTGGNPFYINELLKTIYNDGLINFQFEQSRWTWDIKKISKLNISENVVEFMAERLKELPAHCLDILKTASCIGNIFELKTLHLITQKSASEVASALWAALEEEIIVPLSDDYRLVVHNADFGVTYKFQHDRIQQAAYSLISDDKKKSQHLKIGRTLLINSTNAEKSEKLIQIVQHLNEGRNLITDENEKNELCEMNLQAGKKAQVAIAYRAALNYFKTGIELLPQDSWQTQYRRTLGLYFVLCICNQNVYTVFCSF